MFRKDIKNTEDLPWVEKYRPRTLSNIYGHNWIIQALQNFIEARKIPHLIFTGPAGTGKTSSAIALIRDLLKEDYSADKILEMNASDNVRMKTVQNEIKHFTQSLGFTSGKKTFKFIVLDEADNIPRPPQQALRRIIERSPPHIKFILMCNYENRLIDPIKSRCALFRFTSLPKNFVLDRLEEIAKVEKLNFPSEFYDILYFICSGDMRKAINLLQTVSTLDLGKISDYDVLYNITGYLIPKLMNKLKIYISNQEFSKATKIITDNSGFSGRNLLLQILAWIEDIDIEGKSKAKIFEAIGEIDFRVTMGANEILQILAIIAYTTEMISNTT